MTAREFETIFKSLYLPLGMYALRIVEDMDCAEDLVQEAFMKVWQAGGEGLDPVHVKGYMYVMVRNMCVSHLRSLRERVDSDRIPEVDEETVDTSERDAAIWRAIDSLPEKCRQVFLLSKRDGLSNDEIAEELGISVKTVKNQMTKAFSRPARGFGQWPQTLLFAFFVNFPIFG